MSSGGSHEQFPLDQCIEGEELEELLDEHIPASVVIPEFLSDDGGMLSWEEQMKHFVNKKQLEAIELSVSESPQAAIDYYRNLA